ncbi:MAG: hypothetical protein DWC09_08565 [Candidatus Poseidoniales archaeon]|nr:MAG: hypothetical protein DWC09_08565 [Candidatus Poseidoniales archaeon]
MSNPSQAASTLLLGTGVGCFLIAGFGFVQGRISLETLSTGLVFPVFGAVLVAASRSIRSGEGFFASAFPSEDDDMLVERVHRDLESTRKEESMGSAWAELEAAVLETELSEE